MITPESDLGASYGIAQHRLIDDAGRIVDRRQLAVFIVILVIILGVIIVGVAGIFIGIGHRDLVIAVFFDQLLDGLGVGVLVTILLDSLIDGFDGLLCVSVKLHEVGQILVELLDRTDHFLVVGIARGVEQDVDAVNAACSDKAPAGDDRAAVSQLRERS